MKLFITLGDREHEITVEGDRVVLDGVAHRAAVTPVPGTGLFRLELDGRLHLLAAESGVPGAWGIVDRGDRRDLEVVDERTRHVRTLVGGGKAHTAKGAIRAPMPGLVSRVLVAPGDRVELGSGLVVLEAMKMENRLAAPGSAVVAGVAVEAGQTVEKGDVLVELEEPDSPAG